MKKSAGSALELSSLRTWDLEQIGQELRYALLPALAAQDLGPRLADERDSNPYLGRASRGIRTLTPLLVPAPQAGASAVPPCSRVAGAGCWRSGLVSSERDWLFGAPGDNRLAVNKLDQRVGAGMSEALFDDGYHQLERVEHRVSLDCGRPWLTEVCVPGADCVPPKGFEPPTFWT